MHQDSAQSCMFELVERDAWLDLFAAAPADSAQNLGLSWRRFRDIGVLASREVPIVEFNRAMCVGITAPATDAGLDEASAWLQTNAAPGWALQVAPAAHTGAVHDWLHRRTMTASGTGWAKFERGTSPIAHAQKSRVHIRLVDAESACACSAESCKRGSAFPLRPPNGSQRYSAGQDGVFISRMMARPRLLPARPSYSTA